MDKEFIPYTQALALKELSFDEPCFGWFRSTLIPSNFTEYFLETEFGMNESPSDWVNSNFLEEACSAPLYQQAFRWFREKYNIACYIETKSLTIGGSTYDYTIIADEEEEWDDGKRWRTYEEAELACLIKLIEIVKNK